MLLPYGINCALSRVIVSGLHCLRCALSRLCHVSLVQCLGCALSQLCIVLAVRCLRCALSHVYTVSCGFVRTIALDLLCAVLTNLACDRNVTSSGWQNVHCHGGHLCSWC